MTTPAALHRRLAGAVEPRYSLDKVLQRRRTARVRATREASATLGGS